MSDKEVSWTSDISYCEVCGKEAEYDSEMILCDDHEVDAELRPTDDK